MELNLAEWKGKDALQNKISSSANPVIVLLAAKWCGYCARFLQNLQSYNPDGNINMILTDADDPDESLWDMFRIRLVPTLVVLHQGREIFRRDGRPGVGLRLSDLEEAVKAVSSVPK